MNYYVIVEGPAEKNVYEKWIPQVNPSLTSVDHPSELQGNNFVIVSGNGYPNYFRMINDAIDDIKAAHHSIKLVACVDSEDLSYQEKYDEIEQHIQAAQFSALNYSIVVQFFCFETWALGNSKLGPRKPKHVKLVAYRNFYDVLTRDPEGLMGYEQFNRSQFAAVYLRQMIQDKVRNGSYSKGNPRVVQHPSYFQEVQSRFTKTKHIKSFGEFLKAFV